MTRPHPAPILTFHALERASEPICFPPETFRRGLGQLLDSGVRFCALNEFAGSLLQGASRLTPGSFAITFDDGYESVYREAFPALLEAGVTATVFLTVGRAGTRGEDSRLPPLGGRTMLSWGQIREMHRAGISFGAHTLTHPDLTRLPEAEVEAEIVQSKEVLEDRLGAPAPAFAYPFGRFDARSHDIVRRHFDLACSDKFGYVSETSDRFALPRLDAYYFRSDHLFAKAASFWFPGYVAARAVPRTLRLLASAARRS